MIKELDKMPDGVVGFEVSGMVRAEEYRDVLLPSLERSFAHGDIRFVVVIPDFKGMTGGAVWEDLRVAFGHLRSWKKIALVTDIEWMSHLTSLFGWMTPGETKVYGLDQRDEAIAWCAS